MTTTLKSVSSEQHSCTKYSLPISEPLGSWCETRWFQIMRKIIYFLINIKLDSYGWCAIFSFKCRLGIHSFPVLQVRYHHRQISQMARFKLHFHSCIIISKTGLHSIFNVMRNLLHCYQFTAWSQFVRMRVWVCMSLLIQLHPFKICWIYSNIFAVVFMVYVISMRSAHTCVLRVWICSYEWIGGIILIDKFTHAIRRPLGIERPEKGNC